MRTAQDHKKGQTALILVLLTAAALIFLAITLNWGRVAQSKALLTIAADQGASLLASDAASYGEMGKQQWLQNTNYLSDFNWGAFLSIFLLVLAVVALAIPGLQGLGLFLVWAAIAMAVINLVLQIVVVQPGMVSMWNKLQKNQSTAQQFYEQGLATALQGSVTDQVNITDYFDLNANGKFGAMKNGLPADTISRFAYFYTDRLKMLNQPDIPQVVFFYNQLGQLMNGETCAQNQNDNSKYGIPLYKACEDLNKNVRAGGQQYCINDPIDPACQMKIPGGFQLNDACTDSDPNGPGYNPYCDPCCQPLTVPDQGYSSTNPTPLHPTPTMPLRPSNCSDKSALPQQCTKNNPYYSATSPYPTLLYDPTYQEYAKGISFLDQFGRDQQMGPFTSSLTPQGNFPNGIYPFFWLMKNYSPEVDQIDPTVKQLTSDQLHWCASSVAPGYTPPAGYMDLTQLGQAPYNLPYFCHGQNCCVNFLADIVQGAGVASSGTISITIHSPVITNLQIDGNVLGTDPAVSSGLSFQTGSTVTLSVTASETGGKISGVDFFLGGTHGQAATQGANNTWMKSVIIPDNVHPGDYSLTATATDDQGNSASISSSKITVTAIESSTT